MAKRDAAERARAVGPALEEALYRAEAEGVLEDVSHVAVMAAFADVMVIRTFTRVAAADGADVQQPSASAACPAFVIPYGAWWLAFAREMTGFSGDVLDARRALDPLLAPTPDDYALLARETQNSAAATARVEALERAVTWADAASERLDARGAGRDAVGCALLCGDLAAWEPITVMASRLFPGAWRVLRSDWCREGGDVRQPGERDERVRRVREVGVAIDKLLETDGEGNLALEPLLRRVTERYWTAVAEKASWCWDTVAYASIMYWQTDLWSDYFADWAVAVYRSTTGRVQAWQHGTPDNGVSMHAWGDTWSEVADGVVPVAVLFMFKWVEQLAHELLEDALRPLMQELAPVCPSVLVQSSKDGEGGADLQRHVDCELIPWFMRWLGTWELVWSKDYKPYEAGVLPEYDLSASKKHERDPFEKAMQHLRRIEGLRRYTAKPWGSKCEKWRRDIEMHYGGLDAFRRRVRAAAQEGARDISQELMHSVTEGISRARAHPRHPKGTFCASSARPSFDAWMDAYREMRDGPYRNICDDQLLGAEYAACDVIANALASALADADPWRAFSAAEWKALARLEERLVASLSVLPGASSDT